RIVRVLNEIRARLQDETIRIASGAVRQKMPRVRAILRPLAQYCLGELLLERRRAGQSSGQDRARRSPSATAIAVGDKEKQEEHRRPKRAHGCSVAESVPAVTRAIAF